MTLMMSTHHSLQTNVLRHQYPTRYQYDLEIWLFEILPFIRIYWKKRVLPKLGNAIKNTIWDIDFRYLRSILLQKWLQQFNHFPILRQKPVPQIASLPLLRWDMDLCDVIRVQTNQNISRIWEAIPLLFLSLKFLISSQLSIRTIK